MKHLFRYSAHSNMVGYKLSYIIIGLLFCGFFCWSSTFAVPPPPVESQAECDDTTMVKINENEYMIGNVKIDKLSRQIIVPGWINMDSGVVEYLAVTPDGKTHESVLVLDIKPMHLQLALLLFGLEYGQNLEYQGDSAMPVGDSVEIYVNWLNDSGDSVIKPATDLLFDIQNNVKVPETPWIFTGSIIFEGRYYADVEGSIIATYSDPAAILNNPLSGRADDMVYGINSSIAPPRGTKITLTFKIPQNQ